MADTTLEAALINLFRNGGNMNISQTTAQLHTDAAFRGYSTVQVKRTVLKLEKERILKRETTDGITRFSWRKKAVSRTKRMFVWRTLPSLRDYADGMLCVIATSQSSAIDQAVNYFCGKATDENKDRRAKVLAELMNGIAFPDSGDAYEEISVGCASLRGSA